MYIDPHVHCRDGRQAYKETIAHALSVAERAGFTAIFDMPNTDPPIVSRKLVEERLELARRAQSPVWYGLYMALTSDTNQIREAVDTYNEFCEVVGFKLYAGHSVGNIGITEIGEQRKIYATLRDSGYEGVVALHCEKESELKPDLWDPRYPVTHAFARPPKAEVESVRDQIELAGAARFPGIIHVAHISVPEAVDLVQSAKSKGMRITCGVTPHHLMLNLGHMCQEDGVLYKMNPPLRPYPMNAEMQVRLMEGSIDWVETDHAPHALKEKTGKPYMSGIPGLHYYPRLVERLKKSGFTEEQINDLTFNNIKRAFSGKLANLAQREVTPSLDITGEYESDTYVPEF